MAEACWTTTDSSGTVLYVDHGALLRALMDVMVPLVPLVRDGGVAGRRESQQWCERNGGGAQEQ